MPIYDYSCSHCGHVTEVIHGINDAGPRFCPECGAEGTMRKALSVPAVLFKGSGWAKVDRRSSGGGRSASGSKARSGDSTSSSSPTDAGGEGSKPGEAGGGRGSKTKDAAGDSTGGSSPTGTGGD